MTDTSELFSSYESDYTLLLTDIHTRLDSIPTLSGPARQTAIAATERTINEADEIISQMSLELNNIPSSSRAKPRSRLRGYTSDLDTSRSTLMKLEADSNSAALFGARAGGSRDPGGEQRQQLLSGTERLERSGQRLRDSERIAQETEQVGGGILEDLFRQREMITNTHDTLNDSERYLDRSVKTIRGMARRWVPGFGL